MRDVHGVLFLDKVSGVSSAAFLKRVQSIFQAKKVGHTGTLDPLATGMLPICFGEATKFSQYLLKANKSYRVVVKLGERTDTFDSLGSIVSVRPVKVGRSYLIHVLNTFIGEVYQVPPIFSALKYCGSPLYKYARRGISILKSPRLVNIHQINLLKFDGRYIELELCCSTGTYVRTFVDDLGENLGCGAHVISLRRCSIAQFSSEIMIDIGVLKNSFKDITDCLEYSRVLDGLLYPIDILVSHLPEINVSLDMYRLLRFGQKIRIDMVFDSYDVKIHGSNSQLVRMTVGDKKNFFGVGNIVDYKYLSVHRLVF